MSDTEPEPTPEPADENAGLQLLKDLIGSVPAQSGIIVVDNTASS